MDVPDDRPRRLWTPGHVLSRRRALQLGAAGLAGASGALLFGCGGDDGGPAATQAPAGDPAGPELATIRLPQTYTACMAPLLFAQDYLQEDSISVEYVTRDADYALIEDVAQGRIDMGYYFIAHLAHAVDAGLPIVMLGGAHTACFQVIATEDVAGITDLGNRRLGFVTREASDGDYSFTQAILQHIGIVAGEDVELVPVRPAEVLTALGRAVDAIHTYPPYTLQLADTGQGHVILDSLIDTPWSQNLCCAFFTSRAFLEANPVTTRLALRAMLRGVDHTANDPAAAAQRFVAQSWVRVDSYATRTLEQVPLDVWRTHDPEDSVRFYALLMHGVGVIENTPDEIIARGTDWTFFNELKQELAFAPGGDGRNLSLWCDPASPAGPVAFANTSARVRRLT
jgi:NitT/TauT family transport system substrate-binding protein